MNNIRIWNKLSAMLMTTNEKVHLLLIEPIIVESKEDQGLSTLEKPRIKEIWEDNKEGIIMIKFEGNDTEFDIDDFPEYISQIYEKLWEYIYA